MTALLPDTTDNKAGETLDNVGKLTYTISGAPKEYDSTATALVVEPQPTLSKAPSVSVAQSGDTVTYTVNLSSNQIASQGPLFDAVLADGLIPGYETLVVGSVTVAGSAAASVVHGNTGGDTQIEVDIPVFLPSDKLTVTYQATLTSSVTAGQELINTAQLSGLSVPASLGSDSRMYVYSAQATVEVPGPGIVKTVYATSVPSDQTAGSTLTIGEEVTYQLVVTLPRAITSDLDVLDTLPGNAGNTTGTPGLQTYEAYAITATGAALSGQSLNTPTVTTTATSVNLDFGSVTNSVVGGGAVGADEQIVITVTALLGNAPANQAGQTQSNLATVSFGNGKSNTDIATTHVVEPSLNVSKTESVNSGAFGVTGTGQAGDTVTFDVVLPRRSSSGPAYDVVLADPLPAGFTYVLGSAHLVSTLPAYGATVSYNATTNEIDVTAPIYLVSDPTIELQYSATVDQSVHPLQAITNTASVTYASIGGTTDPAVQRTYGPVSGSATFTVLPVIGNKAVSDVSLPENGTSPTDPTIRLVSIGEVVTYTITATLPASTSLLDVVDQLPVPGPSAATTGLMTYLSSTVVDIASTVSGSLLSVGEAGTYDAGANTVSFDFGTVVNAPGGSGATVTMQITALVANDPSNQAADKLTNVETTTYTGAVGNPGTITRDATVQIVAPKLDITKAPSPTSGDAGDPVTYTVTLSTDAAATAPAYNIVLADLLGPDETLLAGSVTTSAGTIVHGDNPGDTTVEIDLARLLLTDPTVTVTYVATLNDSVQPGGTVVNTVTAAYASAPSNGRPDSGSATASVATPMPATLVKDLVAGDIPAIALPDAAPGETLTYDITTTISEGTQKLLVDDMLPSGLTPVSASVVTFSAAMTSSTGLGVGSAGAINGQDVAFDFGTVVNHGDNNLSNNSVVVEILARVDDATPGGATLTNAAQATVTDTSGNHPQTPNDQVTVTVVAPVLAISKTVLSYTPGDAGSDVVFDINLHPVAQQSTGPAFGTITDTLPAGLQDASVLSITGPYQSYAISGDTLTITLPSSGYLPTAAPIDVHLQAVLADSVQNGVEVTNTASATYRPSPSGGIPMTISSSASITPLLVNEFTKSLAATDNPDTSGNAVAIGEVATFSLQATLAEGTQVITIADALPAGMQLIDATIGYDPHAITGAAYANGQVVSLSGTAMTLAFGTVVNTGDNNPANDVISVLVRARVVDTPGVNAGTTLTDTATLTPTNTDGTPVQTPLTGSATVQVVEPDLVLNKSVTGFSTPGGTADYVMTLGQAADSTAVAYNVTITDLLADPNISLVAGSVTVSDNDGGATGAHVVSNNGTVGLAADRIGPTDIITVHFTADVAASAVPTSSIPNVADSTWSSSPAGTPGSRGYDTTADATLVLAPTLAKVVASTSLPETGSSQFNPLYPDLAIGEYVTYAITITLPTATTQSVVVNDPLPAGLAAIAGSVQSVGSAVSGVAAGTPAVISGNDVVFNLGALTRSGGTDGSAATQVTLSVEAQVIDVASNVAGAVVTNTAGLGFVLNGATGSESAHASVDIVEPQLTIAKSVVAELPGPAGSVGGFQYAVTIGVAPTATSPAYDVVLNDLADQEVSVVPGSATVDLPAGTWSAAYPVYDAGTPLEHTGLTITFTAPMLLGAAPIHVGYDASFLNNLAAAAPVAINTATVTWDSSPTPQARPGDASAQTVTPVTVPNLLSKTIIATDLPATDATDFFRPGVTDLAVGETVTYLIDTTLYPGAVRLTVQDLPPAYLDILSATVTSIGTLSPYPGGLAGSTPLAVGASGAPQPDGTVVFNFGDVRNTAATPTDLLIEVRARVDAPQSVPAGTALDNTAHAILRDGAAQLVLAATAPADLVAPVLDIAKSADKVYQAAGQPVGYTLTVTHDASSTEAAFDVVIADPAGTGAAVLPGSVSVSGASTPATIDYSGSGFAVSLPEIALGETVVIHYTATIDIVPPLSHSVVNTATVVGGSHPGDVPQRLTDDLAQAIVLVPPPHIVPETGSNVFAMAVPASGAILWRGYAPEPSFAGAADPGAEITLVVREADGDIPAIAEVTADAGGNWAVTMPAQFAMTGLEQNTDTYLGATRLFTGMAEPVLSRFWRLAPPDPGPWEPFGQPVTVEAYAAPPVIGYGGLEHHVDNTRIYYAALPGGGAYVSDGLPGLAQAGQDAEAAALAAQLAADTEPFGFAINKFAGEVLATGTVPGVASR